MTLQHCLVSRAAGVYPDRIACRMHERIVTFSNFDRIVTAASQLLQEAGVHVDDRIALLMPNSLSAVALVSAATRIGASVVPLNLRLLPEDWREQCTIASCHLICADSGHAKVGESLGFRIVTIDDQMLIESAGEESKLSPALQTIDPDREVSMIFTSGSSGKPKGVILTNANHYYNALGSNENIQLAPKDCWLLCLPLCHVGGFSIPYRTLLSGASFHITEKFDPEEANTLIDSGSVSHLSLVPTMLTQLLDLRRDRPLPSSVKAVLLGGSTVSDSLIDRVKTLKLPVLTSYGLTEAASQVTTTAPSDSPKKLHTSGRPLRYRRLAILDDKGRKLASGEVGEIAIAGEVLFKKYLGADSDILEHEADWFRTGDLGCLDLDGYLAVRGRKDELIQSGGEKIYPSEILAVAEQRLGEGSCAVIGVPDETWGERPVLFVETSTTQQVAEAEMSDILADCLPRFKLPKRIIFLPQLPRTAIGKIDRERLRREYQDRDEKASD